MANEDPAKTPRYTALPFPPYRHLPGTTPHPHRHPDGHSYGQAEAALPPFDPSSWRGCQDYLYGIDLYNHGYYWEAHEAWEGLWKTTGRTDIAGRFLQGLIQVSAAVLKLRMGSSRGMRRLATKGLSKLLAVAAVQRDYCGLKLPPLLARWEAFFQHPEGRPPRLTPNLPIAT